MTHSHLSHPPKRPTRIGHEHHVKHHSRHPGQTEKHLKSLATAARNAALSKPKQRQATRILEKYVEDTSHNAVTRRHAIEWLGDIGNNKSVPAIRKALNSSDPTLCLVSVHALEKIGGKDAKTALKNVLQGRDYTIKVQAHHALNAIEKREARKAKTIPHFNT